MTLQIESTEYPLISLCGLIYVNLFEHVEKFSKNNANEYPVWLVKAAQAAYEKLDKYYPSTDGLSYVVGTGTTPSSLNNYDKNVICLCLIPFSYESSMQNGLVQDNVS